MNALSTGLRRVANRSRPGGLNSLPGFDLAHHRTIGGNTPAAESRLSAESRRWRKVVLVGGPADRYNKGVLKN